MGHPDGSSHAVLFDRLGMFVLGESLGVAGTDAERWAHALRAALEKEANR